MPTATNTKTAPKSKLPDLTKHSPTALQTLKALADRDIEIGVMNGELVIRDMDGVMTDRIREAIETHRPEILRVARLRTRWKLTDEAIQRLRYVDGIDGLSRAESLDKVNRMIISLTRICDTPEGWSDVTDPFAHGAIPSLRIEFDEMVDGPYPIPRGDRRPRYPHGVLVTNAR